jgi:hypothetical protein
MSHRVTLDDDLYQAIVKEGRFGETNINAPLRRKYKLPPLGPSRASVSTAPPGGAMPPDAPPPCAGRPSVRRRLSTRTMRAYVEDDLLDGGECLHVSFETLPGQSGEWIGKSFHLPTDRAHPDVRVAYDAAITYAKEQEASLGQLHAVTKALSQAGYYLRKLRKPLRRRPL